MTCSVHGMAFVLAVLGRSVGGRGGMMGAGLVLHMVLNLVLSIDGRCSSQSVSLFAIVIKHTPLLHQDVPSCAADCIHL